GIFLRNVRRSARYTFFAGGGRDARNLLAISTVEYFVLRYPSCRRFIEPILPLPLYRWCRDRLAAGYVKVRRSAWRLVVRCRVGAMRFEKSGTIGRVLMTSLKIPVVVVITSARALIAVAQFSGSAFARSRNAERPGPPGFLAR